MAVPIISPRDEWREIAKIKQPSISFKINTLQEVERNKKYIPFKNSTGLPFVTRLYNP